MNSSAPVVRGAVPSHRVGSVPRKVHTLPVGSRGAVATVEAVLHYQQDGGVLRAVPEPVQAVAAAP